jgi:hypothetical protein
MNYLKKNLRNSRLLPADVMRLVYEYADPLIAIRKQIESADYSLDEIMYQRMKKHLKIHLVLDDYIINQYYFDDVNINRNNIDDPNLKNACINEYKRLFLYKHKENAQICGISRYVDKEYSMEQSLKFSGIADPYPTIMNKFIPAKDEYNTFYIKGLFALWRTI